MTGQDDEYDGDRDLALGIEEAYRVIRARIAAGGLPWTPKEKGATETAAPSPNRASGAPTG